MRTGVVLFFALVVISGPSAYAQERPVSNGHYFGHILICDNGFKDSGGQCLPLPTISIGHC
jgi:hypothetical protein